MGIFSSKVRQVPLKPINEADLERAKAALPAAVAKYLVRAEATSDVIAASTGVCDVLHPAVLPISHANAVCMLIL